MLVIVSGSERNRDDSHVNKFTVACRHQKVKILSEIRWNYLSRLPTMQTMPYTYWRMLLLLMYQDDSIIKIEKLCLCREVFFWQLHSGLCWFWFQVVVTYLTINQIYYSAGKKIRYCCCSCCCYCTACI